MALREVGRLSSLGSVAVIQERRWAVLEEVLKKEDEKYKCNKEFAENCTSSSYGHSTHRSSDVLTTATGNTKTTSPLRQSYHLFVGSASKEMAMTHVAAHTSTVLGENRNSCDGRSLCPELTKQQPAKDWSKSKFVTAKQFLQCTRNVIPVTHTTLIAFKTTSRPF